MGGFGPVSRVDPPGVPSVDYGNSDITSSPNYSSLLAGEVDEPIWETVAAVMDRLPSDRLTELGLVDVFVDCGNFARILALHDTGDPLVSPFVGVSTGIALTGAGRVYADENLVWPRESAFCGPRS